MKQYIPTAPTAATVELLTLTERLPLEYVQTILEQARSCARIADQRGALRPEPEAAPARARELEAILDRLRPLPVTELRIVSAFLKSMTARRG